MDLNEMKIKKREEYMEYINTHIENVKKAFKAMVDCPGLNSSTNREMQEAFRYIIDNNIIENHDNSKYSDEEFEIYRKVFYPVNKVDSISMDNFDNNSAWIHHYQNNSHHPEYWKAEDGSYNEMSTAAIIEMIADWEAMSYVFGGSAAEYYEKNKAEKDKVMHPNTVKKVEEIFKVFK